MRQRVLFTVLLLSLLMAVAPITGAQEDRLQIVGSHSILTDVITNVAGDVADVTSVMPRGADPHSFQPTPSDLTALADADVVFINGMFFEEGLLEAIENAGDDMNIVTASSCVEIIAFGSEGHDHGDDHDHEGDDHDHEGDDHDHEGDEHDHEDHSSEMGDMSAMATLCEQHYAEMDAIHEASHDHEEGEDHDHEGEDHDHEEGEDHDHEEGEDHDHEHSHGEVETLGALYAIDCGAGHSHDHEGEDHEHEEGEEHDHAHDHGSCDPHVWMEPHNAMYWTMLIRDTLIEMDPANAETYTANATAYLEELDALAHDFVMPMVETVPEENRVLITNHDAYGYFAARFDFEVAITIIPAGTTLAEPSAADVAAVIDLIREEGVPAIFAETTVSDDLAQQIADETGAEVHVLYSGSLSEADGPASTYVDYIRYNVTTITEALGGGM
ncbi:zinc ABC transporter solute-binding protein [bacterium]|nr:zinc ABC transporter solute-binding protein [bacterium]